MSEHPDPEGLSAYHDGEAPGLADHVQSCEACRTDLARLAAVTRVVGAPVEPMGQALSDGMISRAIDTDAQAKSEPDVPRAGSRRPDKSRWVIFASAAAVVVAVAGFVGFLAKANSDHARTSQSASAPASTSLDKQLAAPSAGAGVAGDSPVNGGELGEIVDDRGLASKAEPTLIGRDASSAADNPVVGPADEAGAVPSARAVGTRACELEARAVDPGAGPLVYVANATQGGARATVLGFAPPGQGSPISLFLMAQDGCRLLERATVP